MLEPTATAPVVDSTKNVATVAVAAKNARIAWAILAHGRDYDSDYQPVAP
jgi:hypothetical protein